MSGRLGYCAGVSIIVKTVTFCLMPPAITGSRSGDLYAYIPVTAFAGALPSNYVYMYVRSGDQVGATSEGGFEEWAIDHND